VHVGTLAALKLFGNRTRSVSGSVQLTAADIGKIILASAGANVILPKICGVAGGTPAIGQGATFTIVAYQTNTTLATPAVGSPDTFNGGQAFVNVDPLGFANYGWAVFVSPGTSTAVSDWKVLNLDMDYLAP